MSGDDPVELTLLLVIETSEAFGVSEVEDTELIWLPKSRVEKGRRIRGRIFEFFVPEWLALEKELV